MLDNNKIQYIGKIENSNNVVIINGNLTIDGQISKDLQTSCLEILRTDFDKYTTTAIEQAKQEIEECIKSILEKLAKEQQKHLTERFQSLSMQAFLHDTLIEYISTEDKRAKEFIIDVLIDRLNFQNISTEKAILNEAIKLIPNLNASTSALITFMMLRQQMVNPSISFMLELFFKQLSPIVDIAYNIKTIDIEYIIQRNATMNISGFYPIDTFENHLLKQYDLFFRQKIDRRFLEDFKSIHPEIMNAVNDMGSCMFCTSHEEDTLSFTEVNSDLFYKKLKVREQKYLIPLIEEFKKEMPPFTATEVRNYFCNLNKNWEQVFNLLNSSTLTRLSLSILGLYIGTKIIGKLTHSSPLSISNFNKYIQI